MREITTEMKEGFLTLYKLAKRKDFIRDALINAYNPYRYNVNMRLLYRYAMGEEDGGKAYLEALYQLQIANIQGIETQEVIGEDRIEELLESYKEQHG